MNSTAIKNIVKKEFALFIAPIAYIMLLTSAMTAIPSYPVIVGIGYAALSINVCFNLARANNDQKFTGMLPVPRNAIVFGRHVSIVIIELMQILVAVPFAFVSLYITNPGGNPVGMDANLSFFGVAFISYAVFNLIFLPWFFRTGYKAGIPMLVAIFAFVVTYGVFEVLHFATPCGVIFDGVNPEYLWARLVMFFVGVAIYIGSAVLSYFLSTKNFRKVTV